MSDASVGSALSAIERLAPYVAVRRDRVLPILIGVSLFVHATVFLPSLFHRDAHDPAKQEIPVEIVQMPPEAPKQAPHPKPAPPKPAPPKSASPKPAPPKPAPQHQQQAAKPQPQPPKPTAQKAEQKLAAKPLEKKQPEPKAAQKPQQPTGEERMKQLLGTMPAVALPGAAANGDEAVDYSQLVLSKVAKAKKQGRYNGIPGASAVAFTIGNAGELVDVHIARASGDPTLDEEAIAMVRRGAPFPPPPPGGRRQYAITLRFHALY